MDKRTRITKTVMVCLVVAVIYLQQDDPKILSFIPQTTLCKKCNSVLGCDIERKTVTHLSVKVTVLLQEFQQYSVNIQVHMR